MGAVDVAPIVYLDEADKGAACAEALVLADELGQLGVPVYLYGELAGGRTRAELRKPGGLQQLHARLRAAAACTRPPAPRSSPRARRWSRSTSRSTRRSRPPSGSRSALRAELDVRALGLQLEPTVAGLHEHRGPHHASTAAAGGRGGPRARDGHRRRARRARAASGARELPGRRAAPGPEAAGRSSNLVGAMAQTKRKRRTKHRGNAAGSIEARGRTGRKPTAGGEQDGRSRSARRRKPPTWNSAALKALAHGRPAVRPDPDRDPRQREHDASAGRSSSPSMAMVIYTPLAYMTDKWVYNRMLAKAAAEEDLMEARWLTVGPVQENTWIARQDGADKALLIDPGDEPEAAQGRAGRAARPRVEAILITHCHFDHVGAVGRDGATPPGARSTAPRARSSSSRTSTSTSRFPGFGPFESYTPEQTVKDGDKLQLAGFEIDVIGTPGHSPDHVTYSIAAEKAIFSGDVLFQGSIGRTDLPGADHADADGARSRSCWTRCRTRPACCPATWTRRRSARSAPTNPFLRELAGR